MSRCLAPLRAQSADDIVAKYIDALGGKDVLTRITSIYQEGTVNVLGNDLPTRTYLVIGKGLRTETSYDGADIVQCITPQGGWSLNPLGGQTDPAALPAQAVKDSQSSLQIASLLFYYGDKGNKIERIGQDTSGSATNLYQLRVITKDGTEVTYFIDAATYHLSKMVVKASVNGNDVVSTSTYADYRKTDFGYVMAYSQQTDPLGYERLDTSTKVEINKAIDPAIFDMPK